MNATYILANLIFAVIGFLALVLVMGGPLLDRRDDD